MLAGVGGRVDYSSASPEAYSGGSHMPEPEPPAPAYGHDAVASQAASSNAGYRTGKFQLVVISLNMAACCLVLDYWRPTSTDA